MRGIYLVDEDSDEESDSKDEEESVEGGGE